MQQQNKKFYFFHCNSFPFNSYGNCSGKSWYDSIKKVQRVHTEEKQKENKGFFINTFPSMLQPNENFFLYFFSVAFTNLKWNHVTFFCLFEQEAENKNKIKNLSKHKSELNINLWILNQNLFFLAFKHF